MTVWNIKWKEGYRVKRRHKSLGNSSHTLSGTEFLRGFLLYPSLDMQCNATIINRTWGDEIPRFCGHPIGLLTAEYRDLKSMGHNVTQDPERVRKMTSGPGALISATRFTTPKALHPAHLITHTASVACRFPANRVHRHRGHRTVHSDMLAI